MNLPEIWGGGNLPQAVWEFVAREGSRAGDFPDVGRYRDILSAYDLTNFPKLREKDVKAIDDTLSIDIPALVRQFDNPYN
jgi:hypothetical protein